MKLKENYSFVLYGDSISRGVIYDEEKSKYVTLEDNFANIINKKLKGVIYNVARFGNTIIRGEKKIDNDVIKRNPDIVLIEFGGNDCDFKWEEVAQNPSGIHEPNSDLGIFENTLKSIIDKLKKIDIVPVLMTLPPLDADRYFKWVSKNDYTYASNILSWLGSVNKIYWWHERYNSAIMDVAEKTNTKCIDVRGAFLKNDDYRQFICVDGIHPNKQGHKLIANKIIEYVNSNYDYLLV